MHRSESLVKHILPTLWIMGSFLFGTSVFGNDVPVTLSMEQCTDVSKTEVERILKMELRTIAVGRKDIQAKPTHVHAHCRFSDVALRAMVEGSATVHTELLKAAEEQRNEGIERLIAIAAAELVFSAWVALTPPVAKVSVPVSDNSDNFKQTAPKKSHQNSGKIESSKSENKDDPDRVIRFKIGIGPIWRLYLSGTTHLFGGELSLAVNLSKLLYIRMGATVEGGKAKRQIGNVDLLAASGLATIGFRTTMSKYFVIGMEGGGRFGYGSLEGSNPDSEISAQKIYGGFGGPVLCFAIGTPAESRINFSVETGYAVYGNTGRIYDEPAVNMKNAWISLAIIIVFNIMGDSMNRPLSRR